MPLKLDVKRKLCSRSERVKSIDLHPELPWVLTALYSGNITIYDHSTQTTVKTFEISQSPVRSAKFISRKQWVVTGSDDLLVRIFNYNTMEKITQIEAHSDYIRYLLAHPTLPYLFSSSDDSTIKIWDWDNNFSLLKTLEDHVHYVMMVAINPRDTNTIASASLDRSIKVWSLNAGNKANFTLNGHPAGVNCVDYCKGDKPYLISGGDDRLVKIWDYQTRQCLHTLEGHSNHVTGVLFHPDLPIIITTSEDCSIKIWHQSTYKLENTLNYNMDRAWCVDAAKDGSNTLAFGFDEGAMVVKIGSDEPVVSMNNGKVIWAKNMDIQMVNLKALNVNDENIVKDGEPIPINAKDLGTADIFPQSIQHSPNGHIFAICSDDEYVLMRAQTFKNSGFGSGIDFAWSLNGDYAVRDSQSVKVYKGNSNQVLLQIKPDFPIEGLFGGPTLAVKSSDFVVFYDWESAKVIRRIDISPKKVFWNDSSTHVALVTAEDYYILQFRKEVLNDLNGGDPEDGFEDSFDLSFELRDQITSALWINDCFIFTNANGKLGYTVGGKTFSIATTDNKKYIIGYIQQQNRLYLVDKSFNIVSYEVFGLATEFYSAIANKNFEIASTILTKIPVKNLDKLAKFLDAMEMKEEAFRIVQDSDHKFDLAIQLGKVQEAFYIAKEENSANKWKQVGDLALIQGKIKVAIEALEASEDLSGLLLIYSSLGMKDGLRKLAEKAQASTKTNIAFTSYFLLSDIDKCLEILIESKRLPEAALFAKTYCPSKISEVVVQWKSELQKHHPITAQKIADPLEYPNEFDDLILAAKVEEFLKIQRNEVDVPAHQYLEYNELLTQDFFKVLQENPDQDLSEYSVLPEIKEKNPIFDLLKQHEQEQGENFQDVEEPL